VPDLASLPKIVASNANLRDYTGAISRQNLDLRQARSDLRRMGCSTGSVIIVGGPNDEACDSLSTEISQMQMDLETLKARRQNLVGRQRQRHYPAAHSTQRLSPIAAPKSKMKSSVPPSKNRRPTAIS
jgi:hypothetical protein